MSALVFPEWRQHSSLPHHNSGKIRQIVRPLPRVAKGAATQKPSILRRKTNRISSKRSVSGAVLENVVLAEDHLADYSNINITENTRGAYPIEFIHNSKIPCVAGHPTDIIFLTCDAFGVLPPVSSLSPAQAMYHFISGYTAKVAGTEVGVTEPSATFSPCFGGPFLVWHPSKYAELLASKMRQHKARVWLVNTGWSGGAHGTGKRISLKNTRAIIEAIYSGALAKA